MNCFWLISSCCSFLSFCLSLLFALHLSYLSLFGIFFFVFASMLLCFLLYALSSSRNISTHFCSVSSFFLYFIFYCSHDAVCLFLCIFQYSLF